VEENVVIEEEHDVGEEGNSKDWLFDKSLLVSYDDYVARQLCNGMVSSYIDIV